MTIPVEIAHDAKRNLRPGPGDYENEKRVRILGTYKSNDSKSSFVDEASFLGLQSPHAYDAKYDLVFNRTL